MGEAFTPGLLVSPRGVVKRIRELPIQGELLAEVGDRVNAADTIARASLQGDLYVLRLPERMGIEPFEVIAGMKVVVGQEVAAGDLMCVHAGLFGLLKSEYFAPEGGVIEFISDGTGHVGLRMESRELSLDAYIGGEVVAVESGKSMTIQTNAAVIQGVFGVGGERHGALHILNSKQEVELLDLPDDCGGKVLVTTGRPTAEALIAAAARGATGFISGSIDDRTLAKYLGYDLGLAITGDEKIAMTVIITEGFGAMTMCERTLKLFGLLEGRACSINGATQVRAGAVRPEVIVSGKDLEEIETQLGKAGSDIRGLDIGRRVKVIRVPYFGEQGEVVELPHSAQVLPTGARARVAKVKLANGAIVLVPRANLELS